MGVGWGGGVGGRMGWWGGGGGGGGGWCGGGGGVGGNVFTKVFFSVCNILGKHINGFWWKFYEELYGYQHNLRVQNNNFWLHVEDRLDTIQRMNHWLNYVLRGTFYP